MKAVGYVIIVRFKHLPRITKSTNLLSDICKVSILIGSINCAAFEIFNELYLHNTILTGTKSCQMASN